MQNRYALAEADHIITPALVYYKDLIVQNTLEAIRIAGDAGRLWPHIKTHKSADLTRLMMGMGINRFKCATMAEAEMLADCGAAHILVAYPLVGPNIARFLELMTRYPDSHFYAIGDDPDTLKRLSDAAVARGMRVDALLDVNLGMNRSGVGTKDALALYRQCAALPGIHMCGLHGYDGHHHDGDIQVRCKRVDEAMEAVHQLVQAIQAQDLHCPLQVMGGTPSFPCHAAHPGTYLSPGTCFVSDYGYFSRMPDLPFVPAAAVLTRVISHPAPGLFTLDLGHKGIAADPKGARGVIVGLEQAEPVLHSEEHWVFKLAADSGQAVPPIGSVLYVLPTHICPTSALYPEVLVAENGEVCDTWPITARNRKLTV